MDAKRQALRGRERRRICPACGGWMAYTARTCHACFCRPAIDRVMDKITIDPVTECWQFTGNKTLGNHGYGVVSVAGTSRVAHRVTYEHYVGPVPVGLQLDHLCRNQACVNPDHLEPVTASENVRRARAAKRAAALWREATGP
jgi:hypothetical protein